MLDGVVKNLPPFSGFCDKTQIYTIFSNTTYAGELPIIDHLTINRNSEPADHYMHRTGDALLNQPVLVSKLILADFGCAT